MVRGRVDQFFGAAIAYQVNGVILSCATIRRLMYRYQALKAIIIQHHSYSPIFVTCSHILLSLVLEIVRADVLDIYLRDEM